MIEKLNIVAMPESELNTIADVLSELDTIIEITENENSPLAIFSFVYRRTTAKVAQGIERGRFENPQQMETFDVEFARLYINAFYRYRRGESISYSWGVAFDAAGSGEGNHIIMQHLLLGMNAHINLDLGIAAAEVAPGAKIEDLRHDFMLVNKLLAELVDEMQQRISRVSPLMFLLDWLGERTDEAIINFSIEKARQHAWKFAQNLAYTRENERQDIIMAVDEEIAGLGNIVAEPPGFLVPKILSVIRFFEEKNPRKVIEKLKQ